MIVLNIRQYIWYDTFLRYSRINGTIESCKLEGRSKIHVLLSRIWVQNPKTLVLSCYDKTKLKLIQSINVCGILVNNGWCFTARSALDMSNNRFTLLSLQFFDGLDPTHELGRVTYQPQVDFLHGQIRGQHSIACSGSDQIEFWLVASKPFKYSNKFTNATFRFH